MEYVKIECSNQCGFCIWEKEQSVNLGIRCFFCGKPTQFVKEAPTQSSPFAFTRQMRLTCLLCGYQPIRAESLNKSCPSCKYVGSVFVYNIENFMVCPKCGCAPWQESFTDDQFVRDLESCPKCSFTIQIFQTESSSVQPSKGEKENDRYRNLQRKLDDLQFPVLCISNPSIGSMVKRESIEDLTTCYAVNLKKGGFYDDLQLVDSRGATYRVEEIEKVKPTFWESIKSIKTKKVRIRILSLRQLDGCPFDDFKSSVSEKLKRSQMVFGGTFIEGGINNMRVTVQQAKTFREVIQQVAF